MFKFLIRLFKKIFLKEEVNYQYYPLNLPPPLGELEERELLEKVKNKDIDSRNKLIEHNMRLVVFIAKKFESKKVLLEDLVSIGSMGLMKGVETFKSDKNIKLATYCSRCIENEILMFFRKISKEKLEISLDETLNIDSDGNELILADILGTKGDEPYEEALYIEKEKVMFEAIDKLNEREKEIIVLRYGLFKNKEMTQKELADYLKISQSYISRLEKKIIDKLKGEMQKKLGLVL